MMDYSRLLGIFISVFFIEDFVTTSSCDNQLPNVEFHYHNFTAMTKLLTEFACNYPTLASLTSIGKSVNGKDLWVLEVTAAGEDTLGIPRVKLIGNLHGNEPIGRELILHLIECLLKNYTEDETVRWLLNNTRIYLMPNMNPDGAERAYGREICNPAEGRKNAANVDLNRDFPDVYAGSNNLLQPESKAVQRWLQKDVFVLSASLHTGALVINYPYDTAPSTLIFGAPNISPDDDIFQHLAKNYSYTHPSMNKVQPCKTGDPIFKDGITNGAAWYRAPGSMQDYNYYFHGCLELTLELSCCKYPRTKFLSNFWYDNKNALINFIYQAHQGIKGLVINQMNNVPISNASLQIRGREVKFRTSDKGEFWRILLPGKYILQVEASGFQSKEISVIVKGSSEDISSPIWYIIKLEQETNLVSGNQTNVPLLTIEHHLVFTSTPNPSSSSSMSVSSEDSISQSAAVTSFSSTSFAPHFSFKLIVVVMILQTFSKVYIVHVNLLFW